MVFFNLKCLANTPAFHSTIYTISPSKHPLSMTNIPLHSRTSIEHRPPFRKSSLYSRQCALHIHHAPATPNESSTTLPSLYAGTQPHLLFSQNIPVIMEAPFPAWASTFLIAILLLVMLQNCRERSINQNPSCLCATTIRSSLSLYC